MDSLQGCGGIFYGYSIDDVLVGMISYKRIENSSDIYRGAVHPCFFRMGIADKLINFVEGLESDIIDIFANV